MADLLYWIFFGLSKMIYSAIPALYDAFSFFAKNEFFDIDTDIREIWGHLYVLLSVLVLFAIAIKLINAIVNPDVLTDSKKGVKKAYFSAIIAVFLTILTPYIFTLLVHVEKDIIDNHIIEKQLFGYNESVDGGKIIAWTAITSFIDLNKLSEETDYVLPSDTIQSNDNHIYAFNKDIDEGFEEINNVQPWKYSETVDQHPILMAISGFIIVYELVLLVMDTALRSIKLGLLQIMTPIILGAYIFKSDILKNWVKEYIKTYLQIFLLLIAISFLTQILRLLPNILVGSTFDSNWLVVGIINMLAIFACLRLVKQIVPLINTIFGTKIQGKGGIKGRLGDMAAVGGLAQKAWGAIGTGTKNVGKLTGKGALAAAGAVPYGVATGISRFATGERGKGFANRMKSGTSFKDLSGIRAVRTAGSAVNSATISALKTGSFGKIKESFNSKINTPVEKARKMAAINDNLLEIVTNSETGNSVTSETNIPNKMAANERLANRITRIGGSRVDSANKDYQRALIRASLAKGIDSDNNAIKTLMTNAMGRYSVGSVEQRMISDKLAMYDSNGTTSELRDFINSNSDLFDDATLEGLVGKNGKLISKDRKLSYALSEDLGFTQSEKDNLGRGSAAVSFTASTLDSAAKSSKENLDIAVSGEMLTELEKMEVDKYIGAMQDINGSLAFAIGRTDAENKLQRSDYLSGSQISSPSTSDNNNTSNTSSSEDQLESSSTSDSSSPTDSFDEVQPATLNSNAKNANDYFGSQNEARIEYLRKKGDLTDSEKAELFNLTSGRTGARQEQRSAARDYRNNGRTIDE